MNRFFAFGCSFTKSNTPTWADILATKFNYYQNWGRPGAGNSFIFYSLVECIKRNNINKDDTVAIMWTSIGREDRFVKESGWLTPGSIYNQSLYNEEFVKNYADPTGYLIRDLAHLSAAKKILEAIGCIYYFFSVVPFDVFNDNSNSKFDIEYSIIELYKDDLAIVRPSVYEVIFNYDWYSRPGPIDIELVKQEYANLKGNHWPNWEKFVLQEFKGIPNTILNEINDNYNLSNKLLVRTDTHPTYDEYYEYLLKVFGNIEKKYVSGNKFKRFE
jgi:hypothetical protein